MWPVSLKFELTDQFFSKWEKLHIPDVKFFITGNRGHFEPVNNCQRYIMLHSGTIWSNMVEWIGYGMYIYRIISDALPSWLFVWDKGDSVTWILKPRFCFLKSNKASDILEAVQFLQVGFPKVALLIGHFRISLSLFLKAKPVLVLIFSYKKEISFTCKLNSFSYKRLCTRPCFDGET